MTTVTSNANQKQVYFKAYAHLALLENALRHIKVEEEDVASFQISILGKVAQFHLDKNNEFPKSTEALKSYWKKKFENTTDFGSYSNPELGNIFIVGPLASTFLYEVDGKALGMLSSGSFGILRGIGASESQAASLIKTLNNGHYLLIFRGTQPDLENYKRILEEKENG